MTLRYPLGMCGGWLCNHFGLHIGCKGILAFIAQCQSLINSSASTSMWICQFLKTSMKCFVPELKGLKCSTLELYKPFVHPSANGLLKIVTLLHSRSYNFIQNSPILSMNQSVMTDNQLEKVDGFHINVAHHPLSPRWLCNWSLIQVHTCHPNLSHFSSMKAWIHP